MTLNGDTISGCRTCKTLHKVLWQNRTASSGCSLISKSCDDHNSKWFLNGLTIWDILNMLNVSQGPSDHSFKWPLNGHTVSVFPNVQGSSQSYDNNSKRSLVTRYERWCTPWAFHRVLQTSFKWRFNGHPMSVLSNVKSSPQDLMTTPVLNDLWMVTRYQVFVCAEQFTRSYPMSQFLNGRWLVTQCRSSIPQCLIQDHNFKRSLNKLRILILP